MDGPSVNVSSSSITPSPENIHSPALDKRSIGDVAESLSRTLLQACKQPRPLASTASTAPLKLSDVPLKPNLVAKALDILESSAYSESASLALAMSRNSGVAPRNGLSQLYKARTVRELPSVSELKLNLSNELKLMKAVAGLAEQFVAPLLSRKSLTDTEHANLNRSLGKLAGLAMLLLKPLEKSGELYKLEASTLKSMQGLLNKAPGPESEKFKNALSHAINKQSLISTMRFNSSLYSSLSESWRNDLDVSLAVINKNASLLEFASADLKNNQVLVFAAAKNNRSALQFASPRLQAEFELLFPPTE